MKTIILYATKYGAAREIAERIASHIDGATLHDLKQANIPALADFDCVIIGSSLYAGSIRKEAKTFLAQNAAGLRDKKIGLFLSGMSADETEKAFESNFPAELRQAATVASLLGGILDPQKANLAERLIMKAITKGLGSANTISDEKIKAFTEALNA